MANRRSTKMSLKYLKYKNQEISAGRIPDNYDVWKSRHPSTGSKGAALGAGAIKSGR